MPIDGSPIFKGSLYRIYRGNVVDEFVFQYNPSVFNTSRSVEWSLTQALGQYLPAATFSRFATGPWQLKLLLYGREGGRDVQKDTARLELFASPGPDFGPDSPQFVSPGRAKLVYGNWAFDVVMNEIAFEHIMFNRYGEPVMSEATLTYQHVSGGIENELAFLDRLRALAGVDG